MNSNTEKQKDLEYFKKLQYDVVVKKGKKRFIVFIPELAVVEEDESLDKAYEKLDSEKAKYFQEMIENGYQDYIKEPEGRKIRKTSISDLTNYLLKLAITIVIIIILGVVGMNATLDKVKKETQNIINIAPEIIHQELIKEASRLRDIINNMTDERRQEIRLNLQGTVKKIKPFLDEFKPLLKDIPTKNTEK